MTHELLIQCVGIPTETAGRSGGTRCGTRCYGRFVRPNRGDLVANVDDLD